MEDNVISNLLLLMFDKINHDLYFKPKNATEILLADKNQVKKFVINTDGYSATFVRGSQIPGAEPDKFYVLLTGDSSGYVLYKIIKTRFIKANKQDLERIKKGDFDDEYRDEFSYYILSSNNPIKQIKLNIKSILSLLPTESVKVKAYKDQYDQYDVNEKFIKGLIEYLYIK